MYSRVLNEQHKDLITSQTLSPPGWITPHKNTRTYPLENTVVVVVDVRNNQGAIQIADKQSDIDVDGRSSWKFGYDFLEKGLVVQL